MRSATLCKAHKHTSKVPIESHHIWPIGYHGPNISSNRVNLCSNAHSDVHYMLTALLNDRKIDNRDYAPYVRYLARTGYVEVMKYSNQLALAA